MEPKLKKIDHLGIAVNSIEEAIPYYENTLGLKCEKIEEVASQKVRTAFFDLGGVHIELLEPMSPDSPVAKFLEAKGPGVHHVAFAASDLPAMLAKAKAAGARLIDETPREGANNKKIACLHPKSTGGVLTEFCNCDCH